MPGCEEEEQDDEKHREWMALRRHVNNEVARLGFANEALSDRSE